MLEKIIFWFSFFFVLYAYLGYPAVLIILSKFFPKPVHKGKPSIAPIISIIIAVKDEEKRIENRIRNILDQDYPDDKIENIVISDGSTDGTLAKVQRLAEEAAAKNIPVMYKEYSPSKGKVAALNTGIELASGEIVVFADARQKFNQNTISELVANFSDSAVGGVSGELNFVESENSTIKSQMGAYWRYEKNIRRLESSIGSVIGVTGAVYAMRKNLYRELPTVTLLDDVLIPMNIVMQGYRVVFDKTAIAVDVVSQDIKQEWKRKIRTLAGNWQLISLRPELFDFRRNKLFFQFFSHKIARLLVPFFLVVLLAASILLDGIFYRCVEYGQLVAYFIAIASHLFPRLQSHSIAKTLYFFCTLNLAAIVGFYIWISGRCSTIWSSPNAGNFMK